MMENHEVDGKGKEGIKIGCQFLVFGKKLKNLIPEYRGIKGMYFVLIRQRKSIPKYVTCFIILIKISEV